jgi:hypothetical protein
VSYNIPIHFHIRIYRNSVLHYSYNVGQRIVARLRERTYAAALEQEVEFVERGEGDVLSRLSVDTSIVGERSTSTS